MAPFSGAQEDDTVDYAMDAFLERNREAEPRRNSPTVLAHQGLRGGRSGSAAHNAVGLAGESPVVGIVCLPT